MAIHFSTVACKIPWTEEPDRLQSMGSQRVTERTRLSDFTSLHLQSRYGRHEKCMKMSVAQLYPTLCTPKDCSLPGSSVQGILQAKILECVAIHLTRGIFLSQRLKLDLLHYRQILYHLSHQGNPRILGWVIYPFSRGSS